MLLCSLCKILSWQWICHYRKLLECTWRTVCCIMQNTGTFFHFGHWESIANVSGCLTKRSKFKLRCVNYRPIYFCSVCVDVCIEICWNKKVQCMRIMELFCILDFIITSTNSPLPSSHKNRTYSYSSKGNNNGCHDLQNLAVYRIWCQLSGQLTKGLWF